MSNRSSFEDIWVELDRNYYKIRAVQKSIEMLHRFLEESPYSEAWEEFKRDEID